MREYHQEDWERLTEYVAGEGSKQDRVEIRARVAIDEEHARLLREVQTIWKATERPTNEADVEAAWERLMAKMQQTVRIYPLPDAAASDADRDYSSQASPGAGESAPPRPAPPREPAVKVHTRHRRPAGVYFLRIAGVLVFIVSVIVLTTQLGQWLGHPASEPEPEYDLFASKRGERALVRLNDGTQVQLNVESRLIVPRQFTVEVREVYLEGEAYFNVAKDTLRPFIIRAGDALVEVVGTAFNVRAYPEQNEVAVAVAEGRVALSRSQGAVKDTVLLQVRHLALVKESGVQVVRHGINLEHYLAWKNGRLIFSGAPFEDVARTLERWYNLRVEFKGSSRNVKAIDVAFEKESLGDVLRVIAATLNLRYEWEGDKVTFYHAPPAPPD